MNAIALIPTAGMGERFGASIPKPLIEMAGRPIIVHTLKVFEQCPEVNGVILIVSAEFYAEYAYVIARYGLKKVIGVVEGGATRTQSVRNGLRALPEGTDMVIVHDGVRPFVTVDMIERGLAMAVQEKAVIAAVPVVPTLKVVSPETGAVTETLDRDLVREVQTPQIFERALFERAYEQDAEATDDAGLLEQLGVPVRTFMGSPRNIKITSPEDLQVAEAFLKG